MDYNEWILEVKAKISIFFLLLAYRQIKMAYTYCAVEPQIHKYQEAQ